MLVLLAGMVFADTEVIFNEATNPSITIVYPLLNCFPQGQQSVISFDVLDNNFTRLSNSEAECQFYYVDSQGGFITAGNLTYNTTYEYWTYTLNETHTADIGKYMFYVHCNSTSLNGYLAETVDISSTGGCLNNDLSPLFIIVLIPILIGLFFMIYSITLGADHIGLKIVLLLGSFVPFIAALHMAMLIVVRFYVFEALEELIGTTTYWFGAVFAVLFFYFLVYVFYKSIQMVNQRKKERLQY